MSKLGPTYIGDGLIAEWTKDGLKVSTLVVQEEDAKKWVLLKGDTYRNLVAFVEKHAKKEASK